MASKNSFAALGAAAGMLMLILDGKTALLGAQEGIDLCIRTVIPSLFPFFVLSPILISGFHSRWLRPLGKLCRIPPGAEPLLLVGFLGGYPTGAQCVAEACRSGQLSKRQAERMLPLCNHAGPSFLFGMVGQMFPGISYIWLLWAVQIISVLIVATILPKENGHPVSVSIPNTNLSQSLAKAIRAMALVCGWVILFRIGITMLERWVLWLLPKTIRVILWGILELSNGCCGLSRISDLSLRFLICSGMLTFGGICVMMQTRSVTNGLSMKPYCTGKLLQSLCSLLLAYLVQSFFPKPITVLPIPVLSGAILLFLLHKYKINSSIPHILGV